MTTATAQATSHRNRAAPVPVPAPAPPTKPIEPAGPLDAAIAATVDRAASIRNTAARFLGVPGPKVCALLRNVWRVTKGQPELTDSEMFMGMSLIARYGLDPIAREVYVTRDKSGRLLTIVGIDGWIKILDRTEHYDGWEQECKWSRDETVLDSVTTRIFSKTRSHPTVYTAYRIEYARLGGFMAAEDKIPWHMLRLFSLRHAARLFTPIGGSVVMEEEARWMQAESPAIQSAAPPNEDRWEPAHDESLGAQEPGPSAEDQRQESPPDDPEGEEKELARAQHLDEFRQAMEQMDSRKDLEELRCQAEGDAVLSDDDQLQVCAAIDARIAERRGPKGQSTLRAEG